MRLLHVPAYPHEDTCASRIGMSTAALCTIAARSPHVIVPQQSNRKPIIARCESTCIAYVSGFGHLQHEQKGCRPQCKAAMVYSKAGNSSELDLVT